MSAKKTPARKACDKAARACDAAWRALTDLMEHLPAGAHRETAERQLREMREWADYLDECKWPDEGPS